MKVKITGTRGPECWYHNRQGEIFEVTPYHFMGMQMSTGDWNAGYADDSGRECLIAEEDCEELADSGERRKCQEWKASIDSIADSVAAARKGVDVDNELCRALDLLEDLKKHIGQFFDR